MDLVRTERRASIAVIRIDHAPVNALAHPVRSALLRAVVDADADPAVDAIVITGEGRHFVAGADIREFDREPLTPLLNDVLLRIEASATPVVAAMHGSVLGGGLELGLACHYRIAAKNTSFGLPEIRLGLLPGSGGTQRLPRLIGAAEALKLMLSGDPIGCERGGELGIVDRTVGEGEELLSAALSFAADVRARSERLPRLREREVPGGEPDAAFLERERAAAHRKFPGVQSVDAIIECVLAAVRQGFEAGLALSRVRFEECRRSDASRALRHLFFAERDSRAGGRAVGAVGVLGAGTMGSGIAISLAMAGLDVVLVDTRREALSAGMDRLRSTLSSSVQKGRLDAAVAAAALERVRAGDSIEALRSVDLVIEAVFESLAVKREVFASLGQICRAGAVLASNTSTLDIDAIATASGKAGDVVGMHFFSPANIMRLVEIVRGTDTAPDVIATARALTRRMGKLGVVVGNCFGFVGNRMLYAYGRENQLMLLEGASPAQVDRALEKFGMAMGPNAVGDLAGIDVGYRVRRERKDLPDDPRYYRVADMLFEAGRLGQKSGRGAYLYPENSRKPVRDPDVESHDCRRIRPSRHRTARHLGRGDRGSLSVRAHQRGRADPATGVRRQPRRHRRHLVQRLWISPIPRGPDVLCGHSGHRRRARGRAALRAQFRAEVLDPGTALVRTRRLGRHVPILAASPRGSGGQLMRLESYVSGRWHLARGQGVALRDASTGDLVAEASSAGIDFREVLTYARSRGGPALRLMTFHERAALLKALAKRLLDFKAEFYELSYLTGATKDDSWIDIDGGIGTVFAFASKGARELPNSKVYLDGAVEPLSKSGAFVGQHVYVSREGAAVHINAFNFPVWGMLEKLAPAILAGVPVIVKPATATAYLTERVVRRIMESSLLPEGALQLICGSVGDLFDHLTCQDFVSFTGSADTAAATSRASDGDPPGPCRSPPRRIRINSSILAPDARPGTAEFDLFIREVTRELTVKAGQKCTAIRRALVPEAFVDDAVEALRASLSKIVVGDPRTEGVGMGPLVSLAQRDDVLERIAELAREADIVAGSLESFEVRGGDRRQRRVSRAAAAALPGPSCGAGGA